MFKFMAQIYFDLPVGITMFMWDDTDENIVTQDMIFVEVLDGLFIIEPTVSCFPNSSIEQMFVLFLLVKLWTLFHFVHRTIGICFVFSALKNKCDFLTSCFLNLVKPKNVFYLQKRS